MPRAMLRHEFLASSQCVLNAFLGVLCFGTSWPTHGQGARCRVGDSDVLLPFGVHVGTSSYAVWFEHSVGVHRGERSYVVWFALWCSHGGGVQRLHGLSPVF